MENSQRPSCKVNTFFQHTYLKLPACSPQQEQTKNTLIQIAEEPPSPLKSRHLNLDAWSSTHPLFGSSQQQVKAEPFMRKTVHLRTHYMGRKRYDNEVKEQKSSQSIIPKLKSLLLRLQSPERLKCPQTESFFKIETAKEDLLNLPKKHNISIRITNHSSQKRYRKGPSVKERVTRGTKQKQLEDHLSLMRQARRKRTLKNLIF